MVAPVGQPHLGEQLTCPGRRLARARQLERHEHVLDCGERPDEVEELKDEPDLLAAQPGERVLPRAVMSVPSITMRPEVGASSPAIRPSSVDLPLPDGPTTATVSHGRRRDRSGAGSSAGGPARDGLRDAGEFNHGSRSSSRGWSRAHTRRAMSSAPRALGWMPSAWFSSDGPRCPRAGTGRVSPPSRAPRAGRPAGRPWCRRRRGSAGPPCRR